MRVRSTEKIGTLAARLLVYPAVLVLGACSDLSLDPEVRPSRLVLAPDVTTILEGESFKFDLRVLDERGAEIPNPPEWLPIEWGTSDVNADLARATVGTDGVVVTTAGGGILRVTARLGSLRAGANVRINPREIEYTARGAYAVQAVQDFERSVSLIAGRQGLMRVFLSGSKRSFFDLRPEVTFFVGGQVVHTMRLEAQSGEVPLSIDEADVRYSFNGMIPGSVVQPGLEFAVDIDPDGVLPPGATGDLRIPADGTHTLMVEEVAPFRIQVVPVLHQLSGSEGIRDWVDGITSSSHHLEFSRTVLPIGEMEVTQHAPHTTNADLSTPEGWFSLIREILTIRLLEGTLEYYYGVFLTHSDLSFGGLGYVGWPTSIGVQREATIAHELGHNVNLLHAPCGGPAGPDPNYPYPGASIGLWGTDLRGPDPIAIDPGEYVDLMSYCGPEWISDYYFMKSLAWRQEIEPQLMVPTGPPGRMLLVWGGVDASGNVVLEPSFVVDGVQASLPQIPGPWRVTGYADTGNRLFDLEFSPVPNAYGGGDFAFMIPWDGPESAQALSRTVLTVPEGDAEVARAQDNLAAIFRDPDTGEVIGIVRDMRAVPPWAAGAEMILSDGQPVVDDNSRR